MLISSYTGKKLFAFQATSPHTGVGGFQLGMVPFKVVIIKAGV